MANDLNQCNFIGRLGNDVETRFLPNGDAVVNFSIACGWKSKDKEGAEWVRIVAFGKLAEICDKYLAKGSRIYISGGMRTRKWQDQSGQDRYTTEIVASNMQMLDSKQDGQQDGYQQQPTQPQQQSAAGAASSEFDDDIPF
tara:strand:+ start:178 stop:600 length:423 start_codon:yes stop_codon:yes gene_type:complete